MATRQTAKAAEPASLGDRSGLAAGDTRQKLIDAAADLFLEVGYPNLRIGDITECAGVGKGTFYLYFETKRELLLAVFKQVEDEGEAVEAWVEARGLDYSAQLALRTKAALHPAGKWNKIIQFVRITANSPDPEIAAAAWRFHRRAGEAGERALAAGMREGVVRELDPELVSLAVLGMQEVLAWRAAHDDKYDSATILAFLADVFSRAFMLNSNEDERRAQSARLVEQAVVAPDLADILESRESSEHQ